MKIGIDVVSVERIEKAMQNPRFLTRILTMRERQQALSAHRVAGRWAAKEAIAKALGAPMSWHDVEVFNVQDGAPYAEINPKRLPSSTGKLALSISHEKGLAVAVALWLDLP